MTYTATTHVTSTIIQILIAVALLVVPAAATYAQRLVSATVKNKQVRDFITAAVQAAEKNVALITGPDKYAYVANLVHQQFPDIPLTQAEMLIESAVFELDRVLGTLTPFLAPAPISLDAPAAVPAVPVAAVEPATPPPAPIDVDAVVQEAMQAAGDAAAEAAGTAVQGVISRALAPTPQPTSVATDTRPGAAGAAAEGAADASKAP